MRSVCGGSLWEEVLGLTVTVTVVGLAAEEDEALEDELSLRTLAIIQVNDEDAVLTVADE